MAQRLGYGLDDLGSSVRFPADFSLFSIASRRGLGPTRPPVQWVPGALSGGGVKRGVKLTTFFFIWWGGT
jgi:hypothetical protein